VLQALADRGTSSSSSSSSGTGGLLLLQQVAQSTASGADCKLGATAGSMQQARTLLTAHKCYCSRSSLINNCLFLE
jgi:hypothetical protein